MTKRKRWEKKVSVYVNVGWERRAASAGWCLIWSPFAQRKKNRSAPNPVERRVLRQSICLPSIVHYSVGCSALRRALRLPSGVPSSIGLSVIRRAFRPPLGSPSSVGHSALRRVLNSEIRRPLIVPPPVESSALRWALRLPLGSLFSVGLSVFRQAFRPPSGYLSSVRLSAVRRVLHFGDQSSVECLALLRAIWGLCPQHADGVLLQRS